VQDRVLDTADVLIDWHPFRGLDRVERLVWRKGIRESQEVPRRVREGVHRVRLAHRRFAAQGTRRITKLAVRGEGRLPALVHDDVVGGEHG